MFGIIVPNLIIPKTTNNRMYLQIKSGWKALNKKFAIEAFAIYIDMNF
jgi:hypothetical protein